MSLLHDLKSNGWAIAADWLSSADLDLISRGFEQWLEEKRFAPAKVGKAQTLIEAKHIRGDVTWWFDPIHPPAELRSVLKKVEDLRVQINRELFLGLKDWEAHLAIYPAGSFYKKHLDRHQDSSQRKLSLVIYLNQEWQPSDGGELVIYRPNGQEITRIPPVGGTLVAFLSEEFPHEVLPAIRERRSLTGWFLDAIKGVV